MNEMKPKKYTQNKKLVCDRTDKKKLLPHHRMLEFYLRPGMIFDKVHEIISFKQSNCLEKYIKFKTQRRNRATNDFKKDFYKMLNVAIYGNTVENMRTRRRD